MIAGALAFLASPLGKLGAIAAALAAGLAAFLIWLGAHDAAARAEWETAQKLAVAAAVEEQRKAGDQAVAAAALKARAEALADAPVREVIRRVPVATACADNPGIRAALDRLRAAGAGAPAAVAPR